MQRKTVTLASVKSNEELRTLIDAANHNLETMGYTEHGIRHVSYVSKTTQYILQELGYDERIVELGAIAGWVHDIGNSVNRHHHGLTGATLTYQIFTRMKMPPAEIAAYFGYRKSRRRNGNSRKCGKRRSYNSRQVGRPSQPREKG